MKDNPYFRGPGYQPTLSERDRVRVIIAECRDKIRKARKYLISEPS